MIAKGKAIAHGSSSIAYALREDKKGKFFDSNIVEGLDAKEIFDEMEKVNRYATRCKNKYLHFIIGIAPQDVDRLSQADLYEITRGFSRRMGLDDHQ